MPRSLLSKRQKRELKKVQLQSVNPRPARNGRESIYMTPHTYRGLAVVAFIDLLGFSRRITAEWNVEDGPLEKLIALKGKIREGSAPPAVTMVFYNDDPEAGTGFGTPRVTSVSDSIMIASPVFRPDDSRFLYGPLANVLGRAWAAMHFAAELGYAVRGAVEIGEIYWDVNEIIGPAFNAVYSLESKVAKSARVIYGPNLIWELALDIEAGRAEMPAQILGMSYKCEDGLYALKPDPRCIDAMEELRSQAPEPLKAKYDETIRVGREPENFAAEPPPIEEFKLALERLKERMEAAMSGRI